MHARIISSPTRLLFGVAALGLAAGCTSNATSSSSGSPRFTVKSTNTACEVSATTAPSGNIVFEVTNAGSQVTEFYFYAADGVRIVGEVENVGPGITRKLVTRVSPGTYVTSCKPGMTGNGIRGNFVVTDSGTAVGAVAGTASGATLLTDATAQYAAYVRDQSNQLLEQTKAFATLISSGDTAGAQALYPVARTHWERIEPIAESFGDLDPILDARLADLVAGQEWTGWHRIEKELWPPTNDASFVPATHAELQALAEQLVTNTIELDGRVQKLSFDPSQLGNGAKSLLDEVATKKVTGEEEAWSRTDLWDFQANIDGARVAFEVLKPVLETKNPSLSKTLTDRFAALQKVLDTYRQGKGFVFYGELSADQVKGLADAVNALSEPLSQVTAAVVL